MKDGEKPKRVFHSPRGLGEENQITFQKTSTLRLRPKGAKLNRKMESGMIEDVYA